MRLALSAVLACGLLTAQLTAATAASRGVLKGRTAQGHPIKLKLQGERTLKLVQFRADLSCRDGSALEDIESGFLPTRISGNGRFRDVQLGSTDTVRFDGRVSAGAVRGRLRLEDRVGKVRCSSRWIRFTVKR